MRAERAETTEMQILLIRLTYLKRKFVRRWKRITILALELSCTRYRESFSLIKGRNGNVQDNLTSGITFSKPLIAIRGIIGVKSNLKSLRTECTMVLCSY